MAFLSLSGSQEHVYSPHLYPSPGPSSPSSLEVPPANSNTPRGRPGTPARRPPGDSLQKPLANRVRNPPWQHPAGPVSGQAQTAGVATSFVDMPSFHTEH